jgi:TPR repeat protein
MTAIRWYLKAADQGSKDAQFEVGIFYLTNGKNYEDLKSAIDWLIMAADQDHI